MKLVVVIPALNEERRIARTIAAVKPFVSSVIVVDDGSEDQTSRVAREAGAVVIHHMINCGPGAATQTGLEYARKLNADYVATFDADGQQRLSPVPLRPVRFRRISKHGLQPGAGALSPGLRHPV